MEENKKLIIVIPTYNELENLQNILPLIKNTLKDNNISGGVLIVDDNSPDGTANLIEQSIEVMNDENFTLYLLKRAAKLGLGTAYIAGYKKAIELGAEFIIGMDADFSHDPKYLPEIYNNLQKYNMVIGSRYVKGGGIVNWNLWRRTVSKVASIYTKLILNWTIKDPTTAFVGFQTQFLQTLKFEQIKTRGYGFLIELKYIAYKTGAKFLEVPIIFADRTAGESKLSKKIILEAVLNCIWLRFRKY